MLFSQALAQQQGALLAKLVRWYTPAEALIMATRATPSRITKDGTIYTNTLSR